MIGKCCIVFSALVVSALCDTAGYSAPEPQYAPAPDSGYGAPTSTGGGYDAPSYGGGGGYDDYSVGYEEESKFDLSKLEELLPLFLAIIVAIIAAQLLSPLLSQLMVLLVGILPMALNIKAPIINMLLAPFDLGLCTPVVGGVPTLFPATARSFAESAGITEDMAQIVSDTYNTIVNSMI